MVRGEVIAAAVLVASLGSARVARGGDRFDAPLGECGPSIPMPASRPGSSPEPMPAPRVKGSVDPGFPAPTAPTCGELKIRVIPFSFFERLYRSVMRVWERLQWLWRGLFSPKVEGDDLVLSVRAYKPEGHGGTRTEIVKRGDRYVLRNYDVDGAMAIGKGSLAGERTLSAEETKALRDALATYQKKHDDLVTDSEPRKGWTHVGLTVPGAGPEVEVNVRLDGRSSFEFRKEPNHGDRDGVAARDALGALLASVNATAGMARALDKIK